MNDDELDGLSDDDERSNPWSGMVMLGGIIFLLWLLIRACEPSGSPYYGPGYEYGCDPHPAAAGACY